MSLSTDRALELARLLALALPTLNRVKGHTIVVKYGGNAMLDDELKRGFARDVVALQRLGVRPVIVHGGGPQIGAQLAALGRPTQFVAGMRVTDREAVEVVDRVLGEEVNREITEMIAGEGGNVAGINGKCGLVHARKMDAVADEIGQMVDLGFVGEVQSIDRRVLDVLLAEGCAPVIAPLGLGDDDMVYNINADLVAGRIAQALNADRLVLLTNTAGMLDANGHLIHELKLDEINDLIEKGIIHGGMLPKIQCALDAADDGVGSVRIADGRIPHCLMVEALCEIGTGTTITSVHRGD